MAPKALINDDKFEQGQRNPWPLEHDTQLKDVQAQDSFLGFRERGEGDLNGMLAMDGSWVRHVGRGRLRQRCRSRGVGWKEVNLLRESRWRETGIEECCGDAGQRVVRGRV